MTPQPFSGFETYATHHCVTGSLKHVYDFHGLPISEDMLLGLGSGLGFAYFHFTGTDPFYGGRANHERPGGEEGLERTVGRRTGVAVSSHHTTSPRKAQESLRERLVTGQPVMVYLDMGFLPYFDFGGQEYHFGGHVVVVAGYDPDTEQVLLADRDPELHPVDWDTLEQARGSTFKPFPPKHHWYDFDFADARPPTPDEVQAAIDEVCAGMLEPPISNLGVKGIRKAQRETRKWPVLLDDAALRRTCFSAAMFIDHRGGTGGGIFRYMYARFLEEAADVCGQPRLARLAAELVAIGDRWEEVAAGLDRAAQADDPTPVLVEATEPMVGIADAEQAFWEALRATGL